MLDGIATSSLPAVRGKAGPVLRVTLVLEPATAGLLNVARLAMPDTDVRVHAGTLASFVANAAMLRQTDVLIAQLDPENPREFEEFERLARDNGSRMPVIAAVRDLTVAITRRVLRSDAVDVLSIPFTPDELHQAVETGRHRRSVAAAEGPVRAGRIVTFLGALGGMGTTAIATQAGIIWAESKNVCLIDLDVQFGNAALYLDLKPQLNVSDLIEAGDRLDAELLRSVAEVHASGLNVIACPADMVPLDALTPDLVNKLLDVATETFDIVMVDLPGAWLGWSLSALERSDAICLITGLSVPGMHQARRQLEVIDANGLGDRVRVILNRVIYTLFGKIDLAEPEAVLGRKIDYAVANDYATVSAAIDQGRLLSAVKVKSRVERDLRNMVTELASQLELPVARG